MRDGQGGMGRIGVGLGVGVRVTGWLAKEVGSGQRNTRDEPKTCRSWEGVSDSEVVVGRIHGLGILLEKTVEALTASTDKPYLTLFYARYLSIQHLNQSIPDINIRNINGPAG